MFPFNLANNYISFTPQAEDFFSYLSVQPSYTQKVLYDKYLFKPLIASGIFAQLDRLWVAAVGLEQWGTISLVNPSSTALTLVNTPTFTANEGWTGNGTTQYINTNYNFSSSSSAYTLNSGTIFSYLRTNAQANTTDLGAYRTATLTASQIRPWTTSSNLGTFDINDAAAFVYAISASSGLLLVQRTASNAIALYRNGSQLTTGTQVSVALVPYNCYALARNGNGTADAFSTRQQSIFGIGNGSINNATLSTILNGYMTAIGKNVY